MGTNFCERLKSPHEPSVRSILCGKDEVKNRENSGTQIQNNAAALYFWILCCDCSFYFICPLFGFKKFDYCLWFGNRSYLYLSFSLSDCTSQSTEITMSTAEVLRRDADELNRLASLTESVNVKRILTTEAAKLAQLAEAESKVEQASAQKSPEHAARASLPTTKIYNYGWDQSEKFLKIYVTFNGVQTYPSKNVTASYGEKSFELQIHDEGKKLCHVLAIKHLLHSIKPEESYLKVKTDMVVLFLKKASTEHWKVVTEGEKKTLESKAPKMDKDEDPNTSLMKLVKQMYDDGDDEMKRTIAKSWTEAREKKPTDELMNL